MQEKPEDESGRYGDKPKQEKCVRITTGLCQGAEEYVQRESRLLGMFFLSFTDYHICDAQKAAVPFFFWLFKASYVISSRGASARQGGSHKL